MLNRFLLIISLSLVLMAKDFMTINSFETDVLNKQGKIVSVETSFRIEGRDLADEKYKIMDSLHIVIGGYTLNDLITSRGKRWLKTEFIKVMDKEYGVDIEAIYISKFKVKNKDSKFDDIDIKELIQTLQTSPCLRRTFKRKQKNKKTTQNRI